MSRPLGATSMSVLRYIYAYIEEHGYSPSILDIKASVGLSSSSVVRYHLLRLQRIGRITWERGLARTIRIIGGDDE